MFLLLFQEEEQNMHRPRQTARKSTTHVPDYIRARQFARESDALRNFVPKVYNFQHSEMDTENQASQSIADEKKEKESATRSTAGDGKKTAGRPSMPKDNKDFQCNNKRKDREQSK